MQKTVHGNNFRHKVTNILAKGYQAVQTFKNLQSIHVNSILGPQEIQKEMSIKERGSKETYSKESPQLEASKS